MFVSSFNFNVVCTSAGFHFFPQTIFTNFNTQLTDCTSRECYALDSYRTTEERNYSTTCSPRGYGLEYLHFRFCISEKFRVSVITFNIQCLWSKILILVMYTFSLRYTVIRKFRVRYLFPGCTMYNYFNEYYKKLYFYFKH